MKCKAITKDGKKCPYEARILGYCVMHVQRDKHYVKDYMIS